MFIKVFKVRVKSSKAKTTEKKKSVRFFRDVGEGEKAMSVEARKAMHEGIMVYIYIYIK